MKTWTVTLAVAGALGLALGAGCSSTDDSLIGGGSHVGPGAGGGNPGSGSPGGVNPGINNPSGGGANPGSPGNPGGPTPPPPPNVSPSEAYFITTVYPALSTSPGADATGNPIPACASCHASGSFGAPTFLAGARGAGAYT